MLKMINMQLRESDIMSKLQLEDEIDKRTEGLKEQQIPHEATL